MVVFILQGLAFILLGLQLSTILSGLSSEMLVSALGLGALLSVVVIVVRLLWFYAGNVLVRLRGYRPGWREATVAGWSGMRGVVSLATALALPLDVPGRPLLIFLTFCVILATLVGQGLTLPLLIRKLRIVEDDGEHHQELHARIAASEAATARIDELAEEWPGHLPLIDALRAQYSHRAGHLEEEHAHEEDGQPATSGEAEQELLEHRLIRREVIDAERDAILDLRTRGDISDDVWRRIERDLDLEAVRMDA
jgi:CPA1 family monovalent cation:H+ antiporter